MEKANAIPRSLAAASEFNIRSSAKDSLILKKSEQPFRGRQLLLTEAKKYLLRGNIMAASHTIRQLYKKHITCDCFFRNQPADFWALLLKKMEKYVNDPWRVRHNVDENFFFGFVYLQNGIKTEAYSYLSCVIKYSKFEPSNLDLYYFLRSSLGSSINPHCVDDAQEAVLLNPTARNYFGLATAYIEQEKLDEESNYKASRYFDKTLLLNPQFACVYKRKGEYLKCIEIDPNHDVYYDLWYSLDQKASNISGYRYPQKEFDKALRYLKKAYETHTSDVSYQYALGIAHYRVGEYEAANQYFNNYLQFKPGDKATIEWLSRIEVAFSQIRLSDNLEKALSEYTHGNYSIALEGIEAYLKSGMPYYGSTLSLLCKSKLKIVNPSIQFDESNPHYSRLKALKESYRQKKSKKLPLTEEEQNVSKLKEYFGESEVGFGHYKGSSVEKIFKNDPHYMLWCIINLTHFCVTQWCFLEDDSFKADSQYLSALEINTIKLELLNSAEWRQGDDRKVYRYQYDYDEPIIESYEDWLEGEFGDEAGTAYWNLD